jgi:hypothetical protein
MAHTVEAAQKVTPRGRPWRRRCCSAGTPVYDGDTSSLTLDRGLDGTRPIDRQTP